MDDGASLVKRSRGQEMVLAGAVLLVCASLWLIFGTIHDRSPIGLAADGGVVVLPASPLDHGEIFALEGPWQVYWGRLLTPGDLARSDAPAPDGALRFPGSWRGERFNSHTPGGPGAATFRLGLKPPDGNRSLTLRLLDLRIAYRLWANGQLIAESGRPGLDTSSERADRSLVLAALETTGQPVDLVLELSNHQFRAGGVGDPILLAKTGPLQTARDRVWILSAFFCGVLLVAGIYHLLLHSMRSREISFLYFGIYTLLIFGYAANSNTTYWLSHAVVADWLDPALLDEISIACYAASGAVLFRFYRSLFPEDFSRRLQIVSDLRPVVFLLSIVVLPPIWRSWLVVVLMAAGLCFTAYFLIRLTACVIRQRPGAILLMCGALLLASTSMHDILVHADVIEGEYLALHGLFALVVFQSSALALRYARNFEMVEQLSLDLHRNIDVLKDEMSRRRELEGEVVRVSEEERRRVSYQLHDGLCQQLTAARLRYSMLSARDGEKGSPTMIELGRILSEAAEDAYALSRGMWPVEHDPAVAGPTLGELVDSAKRASGIDISLAQNWPCTTCEGGNLGVLYRIAQEALTNAVRHADATRISVSLCCEDGTTELEVEDNGAGRHLDAAPADTGGLGLRIMKHRANAIGAEFAIEDSPGGGTVVRCRARCLKGSCSGDRS